LTHASRRPHSFALDKQTGKVLWRPDLVREVMAFDLGR
jgi:hypothetical protein